VTDGADLESLAVAFAAKLRADGVRVPVSAVAQYVGALAALDDERPASLYWAGRATLVCRRDDIAAYDRAFRSFFGRAPDEAEVIVGPERVTVGLDAAEPGGVEGDDSTPRVTVRWSPHEVLRAKDFAHYTLDEHAEARRLMDDLRLVGARRRSRRMQRAMAPAPGGRPDVRATVRGALRTGGDPFRRVWSVPGTRLRRVVFLVDVSGSMDAYARPLLRFVHAARAARSRVEVFTLGTRLTRVTRELGRRDPDTALARATRAVADWSGGTRLGPALRAFNDQWGVRGVARGAVVVIVSDGWDRGDASLLAEQMARLRRVAYRIVWVNPLKAAPGYAPLARGMAAALPYIDEFVAGHSVAALAELTEAIGR